MPNDPSEAVVDWSKVTKANPISEPCDVGESSQITVCNESANLTGFETAGRNQLTGIEIFSKDDDKE